MCFLHLSLHVADPKRPHNKDLLSLQKPWSFRVCYTSMQQCSRIFSKPSHNKGKSGEQNTLSLTWGTGALLCCLVIFFYSFRRPSNQLGGLSIGPNSHPTPFRLITQHHALKTDIRTADVHASYIGTILPVYLC